MEQDCSAVCGISRAQALELMRQYLPQDAMQKHCLAAEAIMRALARRLGAHEDVWGIAGLLHDLDYNETRECMSRHGLETERILKGLNVAPEIVQAIKAHNADNLGFARTMQFEHALVCAECITGLIVATTLVYPEKKIAAVKSSSILKRMKQKEFARSVNRDYIRECEMIGIPLEEFAALSLSAMTQTAPELGL
jgi:putative nucleotidyltransferase with HDIG domain